LLPEQLLQELIFNKQMIFNCPVDQGRGVVIKENGALSICTHLSSYEVLSSIETKSVFNEPETFVKFWNSPEMSTFRETANVYRYHKCAVCRYRFYCKGGCPLWWKFFDFRQILKERR